MRTPDREMGAPERAGSQPWEAPTGVQPWAITGSGGSLGPEGWGQGQAQHSLQPGGLAGRRVCIGAEWHPVHSAPASRLGSHLPHVHSPDSTSPPVSNPLHPAKIDLPVSSASLLLLRPVDAFQSLLLYFTNIWSCLTTSFLLKCFLHLFFFFKILTAFMI